MQSKETALSNLKTFRVELTDAMRQETYREGVLIRGDFGWSEFAPFPHHTIEHSARWLQAALEMAWSKQPEPIEKQIKVNAISTSPDPKKAIDILTATGCKTLKVKLNGTNIDSDIAFLEAVISAYPEIVFRIDFNGSLKISDALNYSNKLSEFNIEYIEQPCKSIEEIKELKALTKIPVAIDENLRLANDATNPEHIKTITDVADFIVIKPIPVGGIKRFQSISEQVIKSGKKVVVSGSMDTSIGLYETLLAQSLLGESSQLVAGAGTGSILSTDVVSQTLRAHNGVIEIKRLEVDESKVTESPNQEELIQRLNLSFDFGRERNWF
jgi:o-succinylbenzoate synthase